MVAPTQIYPPPPGGRKKKKICIILKYIIHWWHHNNIQIHNNVMWDWHYFIEYCQSHKTLLWIWILLWAKVSFLKHHFIMHVHLTFATYLVQLWRGAYITFTPYISFNFSTYLKLWKFSIILQWILWNTTPFTINNIWNWVMEKKCLVYCLFWTIS